MADTAEDIQELVDFTTKHIAQGTFTSLDHEIIYVNGDRDWRIWVGPGEGIQKAQAYESRNPEGSPRALRLTVITLDGRVLYDTYFSRRSVGRYPGARR